MTTNGRRNKNAGHSWERQVVDMLKEIGFPNAVTTRSESRGRDAQKIDVMNKDEGKNGRLPYNIQAKTLSKPTAYPKLLSELPQDGSEINVVFHKQTQKDPKTGRFMPRGTYAITNLKDFIQMMKKIEQFKIVFKLLTDNIDYIPDEERPEVEKQLKKIGL